MSRQHPLGEAATLVAGLVGLLVAVGALVALGVDVAVRLIPPEFEARVFPEFPGGGEPSPDPRREAVQLLLERLAARWPEAPYPFRVRLLADAQVNAAALPGGSLLVTVGLLDAVGSENELAFVLAHELGHFAGRHHLRRLGRRAVYGLALAALTGHGGTGGDLGSLAGELTSRGFDRSQEREADAFGLGLVAGEYGHVAGAAELFAHFGSEAPAIEAVVAYFSTHPAGRDRIEALTAAAASRGWSTEAELRPLAGPLAR